MNKTEYCNKLLKYRKDRIPLYLFLGGKWIFLKVLLIAIGVYIIQTSSSLLGGMVIGYALGKIAAGIMSYKASKKTWEYSQDLLDWEKIDIIAKGRNDR